VVDQAVEQLGAGLTAVCADRAYASGANRAAFEDRGIRLVSPPPKPITYTGRDCFTVEDFRYDAERDVFACPGGATLHFVGWPRTVIRGGSAAVSCVEDDMSRMCTPGEMYQGEISDVEGRISS